jgi:hypothetical protein
MPVMQIRPEDVPQLVEQNKAAIEALSRVLEIKRECLGHFESMEASLANQDVAQALASFVAVQRIEYELQVAGFEEKLKMHQYQLQQLENPIAIPSVMMPEQENPRHGQIGGLRPTGFLPKGFKGK